MKKHINKTIFLIFTLIGISYSGNLFSQISYLGKISQHEDGVYGLTGTMSICFSIDKKNVYVSSQYALAVFNYDESTGSTEIVDAYRNDDDSNAGLNGPCCIKISPDDKYVYVSSDSRNCISLYRRDTNSGTLQIEHVFYDTDAGFDGLRGAHEMGITKDGLYIVVAAWNDAKISTFRRDTVTGYISHIQSISGLSWPKALKLSRDSRFVYVASHMDDKVAVYEINPDTGELIYVESIHAESGQYGFSVIEISYDDRFLYLAGRSSLSVYTRNTHNGKLTLKDLFKYDDPGISGMKVIYSIAVSPDDKNIYAITAVDTAFVTFSRNLSNDEFHFTDSRPFMSFKKYSNDERSTTSLICDNNYVFGTSYWESGVHVAKRNQSDGSLDYERFIYEGENAIVDGLYNPRICSADEQQKMVYVTSYNNGISIFQRNDTTGKLIFKNVVNNQNQHTAMLWHNAHTVLSKDGNYLYTMCQWENTGIAIFKADHTTDNLILIDSIMSDTYGSTGFDEPLDLAFSPEGKHLYVVSSYNQMGIAQYLYNPQNGSLELERFYKIDNIGDYFDNISISNEGNYVFIWNTNSGDITMLGRDKISGALTYLSTCFHQSVGGVYGLTAIAISNDQKNLYAAYANKNVFVNFSIDSINHKLDVLQFLDFETLGINGLKRIQQIGVRSDGTFVYTSSYDNNSVGLFYRDQSDGMLTFLKDYTEPENDFDGLDKVNGICIPTNDRNLYLISDVEEAVASYSIDLYLGPDRAICKNDSALLDAGKGYATYLWSTNETTQRIYAKEQGYYHVKTIDEFGFVDHDTLYLEVYQLPEIDLGPGISSCSGNAVILNSGFNGENLWNTGSTSESITVEISGTYSVVITDNHPCKNKDSVDVIFHPLPEVNLGADTTVWLKQTLFLSVDNIPEYGYLWHNGSTNSYITINDNSITNNLLEAWVEVTTNFGCKNSDTLLIKLDKNHIYIEPVEIKVSPVPTAKFVDIKSNCIMTNINCYDINGKHLFTKEPNSQNTTINTTELSRGIYLLRIALINGLTKTVRIIKI